LREDGAVRRNPIQVAVDVDLEQHRRKVRRPPCCGCIRQQSQLLQIELFDEGVDRADRVVVSDIVVETLGQQRGLHAAFAFDESLMSPPVESLLLGNRAEWIASD